MTKKKMAVEKQTVFGIADKYVEIKETVKTPKVTVEFRGDVIRYKIRGPNGGILRVLQKKYQRHAVAGIHGRIIRGDYAYLSRLVNKIELEQAVSRLKMGDSL